MAKDVRNKIGIWRKRDYVKPKEVVSKWVDAFNNHDVEEITSLYHEDATNHQVANEPVIGIEAPDLTGRFTSSYWFKTHYISFYIKSFISFWTKCPEVVAAAD